ncbi:unnamed protein product, partial [Prorocentrum cordatum]
MIIAPAISPIQRGFVRGLNFMHTALDLDTFSGIASLGPEALMAQHLPLGFDFAQSFAALSQRWLCMSLRTLGPPSGILGTLAMFNFDVQVFEDSHAGLAFPFIVNSSVLQGCPLSGDLCAMGAKIFPIDLAASFEERRRAAALACLAAADAAWAAIDVVEHLQYLGIILGVSVSPETQRAPQLAAWRERAWAISKKSSCFSAATAIRRRRAIPALGYGGRISPLPWNFTRDEVHIHSRLVHSQLACQRARASGLARPGGLRRARPDLCQCVRCRRAPAGGLDRDGGVAGRLGAAAPPGEGAPADGHLSARALRGDAAQRRAPGPPPASGLGGPGRLAKAVRGGMAALHRARELLQAPSAARDGGPPSAPGGKPRLQGVLSRTLRTGACCNDLAATLTWRARRRLPSVETPEALDWESLAGDLRRAPQAWRMALPRTWARAWPTAARLQSRGHPRIFGCAA